MIDTMFGTTMRLFFNPLPLALIAFVVNVAPKAEAASFTKQVFATGAAIGATSPDSVEFGDGSLWISYQNGADTTGASGSSTVVRYSPSGSFKKPGISPETLTA